MYNYVIHNNNKLSESSVRLHKDTSIESINFHSSSFCLYVKAVFKYKLSVQFMLYIL